ncbi:MAG: aldehyde dehydrogenase family protein [Gemmataceae bacterium]
MKPLLVVVDLQHDYLVPGLEPAAESVVGRATQLLNGFRELGLPVAHLWTTVARQPDQRMLHWKQAGRWRCMAGSPGHQPPPALTPRQGESVLHKTGYSAATALRDVVKTLNVDSVIVAGVHLHACVRQAALDAYEAGLRVWIAEDAVGSDDPLHAAVTRRYLAARTMHFQSVDRLLAQLREPAASWTEPAANDAVNQAVERAQGQAKNPLPRARRCELIRHVARLLVDQSTGLARQLAEEIGKPVRFGTFEVQRTAEMLDAVTRRFEAAPLDEEAGPAVKVRCRPHGVVAVITPWNNPIYLALGKIAPALLAGNSVVWKPAVEAVQLARVVCGLTEQAGWPDGLLTVLEGGAYAGEGLLNHPGIAAATFTGSLHAGYCAQEICARRRIPFQAELGGNNAALIWPDADLEEAARKVAAGAFEMAGQRCTANRRVIVEQSVLDRFLPILERETAALDWGDPSLPETKLGPLLNDRQQTRVSQVVDRALTACGPARLPHGGHHFPPGARDDLAWYPATILCCDRPECEIVQEETFGPVLVVQPAHDWEHAMDLCNGVRQGLAAAVFTRNPELIRRFLDEAQAGILKVNESTADAAVDVPFGGWKASGLGPPEHGQFDRDFYTRPQTVYGVLDGMSPPSRVA